MSPEALGIAMLALMVVAILIGFPTAFTLMALGMTFGFLGIGFVVFDLVVQRTFFVMQNDVLVAIPLFLFMGYLVERAGILDKLFMSVQPLMGGLPGALAIATLSRARSSRRRRGSSGASVTLLGLLALPAMMRRGYNVSFGSGVIVAAGNARDPHPAERAADPVRVHRRRLRAAPVRRGFHPGLHARRLLPRYIIFRAWRESVDRAASADRRARPSRSD